jgi:hypothetical protein
MTRTSFPQPFGRRARRGARARFPFRPRLEHLEDRAVPSTVTTLGDSGTGSLRDAILNTPAGGTVDFQPGLTGTITLTSGELAVGKDLTITGPGAGVITVSGNHASRVFDITAGSVAISGLTVADGFDVADNGGGRIDIGGGGIANQGQMTITNCVISGNTSRDTGGAFRTTAR